MKGGSRERLCKKENLLWVDGNFTLLGVTLNANLTNIIESNYREKLDKSRVLLNIWKQRNLSLFGRITNLESLALPKLIHLFSSLPSPLLNIIRELELMCLNFVWGGKVDKVKRNVLINDLNKGGAKMPHIDSIIKSNLIAWVHRSIKNTNSQWKRLFDNILSQYGGTFMWEYHPQGLENISNNIHNNFWKDVLTFWGGIIQHTTPTVTEDFLSKPLWYNPFIKINKKFFFGWSWHKAGIKCINDLIHFKWKVIYFWRIQCTVLSPAN